MNRVEQKCLQMPRACMGLLCHGTCPALSASHPWLGFFKKFSKLKLIRIHQMFEGTDATRCFFFWGGGVVDKNLEIDMRHKISSMW